MDWMKKRGDKKSWTKKMGKIWTKCVCVCVYASKKVCVREIECVCVCVYRHVITQCRESWIMEFFLKGLWMAVHQIRHKMLIKVDAEEITKIFNQLILNPIPNKTLFFINAFNKWRHNTKGKFIAEIFNIKILLVCESITFEVTKW